MAAVVPNFEEAAALAIESISNLDNLPNEVQHILNEINHLEKKCQDLQNEIARDQRRYIRDAIRPSLMGTTFPFSPGSETPNGGSGGSTSRANAPRRISLSYKELDALSSQKIKLAERLIDLLTRTQAKLDADVKKVRSLQGEPVEDRRKEPAFSLNTPTVSTPASQISENLRNALNGTTDHLMLSMDPGTPTSSGYKKRRLTTQTSVKITTPIATSTVTASTRSRPSRQATTKLTLEEPDDEDLDAEGEEDFEGDEGEEDPTLYCFCQKRSYGDMIGCDNPDCPYQWFHISCVGVKTPLPDKWYCPTCVEAIKTKASTDKRKGRNRR